MKKKIVIGSILAVFILLLLPSCSAINVDTFIEQKQSETDGIIDIVWEFLEDLMYIFWGQPLGNLIYRLFEILIGGVPI